jgi:hypothetical protein
VHQANLPNLTASYAGGNEFESVLVLVFNTQTANDQVTGTMRAAVGATVVDYANVVVLYQRSPRAPNHAPAIQAALSAQRAGT